MSFILLFFGILGAFVTVADAAHHLPPSIYLQSSSRDVYFKGGEVVPLPCAASGNPQPIYRWKRNGLEFNPSGQDDRVVQLPGVGTLVINPAEDKDEGVFQCLAENPYGISVSDKINLREATLASFAYEERQTHYVQAGQTLTLPCTPPLSHPRANITWVIKEPDGRLQAVTFDKRVSMDLEGRLRFTNVEKQDEAGGRVYSCMAMNNIVRDNTTGPEHVIRIGGTGQNRPVTDLWTSPADQVFLKGQTVRLKCIFGGNPTPDVFWQRFDAVLPDRAQIQSFGQTLELVDLRLSDAGRYKCIGMSRESSVRRSQEFTIRIESGPYWIEKPVPQEKSARESATFICKAGGLPEPTYSWYINGVPYENVNDPRLYGNKVLMPTSNNLTITDLSLLDYMGIQCNASNKHNYIFADFFLNVLAYPSFSKATSQGHIDDGDLDDASGLAASRKFPGILYAHNDHGDRPRLFAINASTAHVVAVLTISPALLYDWEDICVGPCEPARGSESCIYISDDGEYNHKDQRTIYKVVEPTAMQDQTLVPKSTLKFSWTEPGSKTIMVDPDANVYIIGAVRGGRGMIIKLPNLSWDQPIPVKMDSGAYIGIHPSKYVDPNAGDISPDGNEVIIKTMDDVYYWSVPDHYYLAALTHPGQILTNHTDHNGQGLCFSSDGQDYYTLAEGSHKSLYKYTRM